MTKKAGACCAPAAFLGRTGMRVHAVGAARAAMVVASTAAVADRIAGAGGGRARRAATWRRAGEQFAVADPAGPPAAATEWRRIDATVDPNDTNPGPFGQPLQRLGNAQNAFARLDGPPLAGVAPGAQAIFTAVVAVPTTLSSALMLTSAFGQAELHVDWTEVPPRFFLVDRRAGLAVKAGAVEGLGFDIWRLALAARNEAPAPVTVRPSLHVASGIGNAGMVVGLYAGLLRTGCADPSDGCSGPATKTSAG
jgi:hypothetical protein